MSSKRAGIKRRRQHSAELKARAALEAIQERRTINEIAAEYGVHPTQVSAWKRQAVESLSAFFDGGVRVDGNACKRQESGLFQAARQAMISGQDGGEDGARIQLTAGQEPQFAQSRRAHFLGFIDQEHRTIQRVLDVMEPLFPQNFGTGPSVVRSQRDRIQVAKLAIKIGQRSLWTT